jgi:hypothetical protein
VSFGFFIKFEVYIRIYIYDKTITLENFLNEKGRVSSTKSTKKWVGRNFPEDFKEIKNNTEKIGLYQGNQLMSIMTFRGLRRILGSKSKERHWELIRFFSRINITIIGGASKLLNHFIETYKPSVIISYCDRRWSNGEFYKKLGLILESKTRPNYHYVKNGLIENRYKYRKDVLVSQGFDPDKSEREIMSERGFFRIYDCGTYRFRWETKKDQF